jgi:hypothetical protein
MQGKLSRGEFVKLLHRLGHRAATGALLITEPLDRRHVVHLRRGYLTHAEIDGASPPYLGDPSLDADERVRLRRIDHALERLAALVDGGYRFEPHARPAGDKAVAVSVCAWARKHLEARVDAARATALAAELAGARLALDKDLVPDASLLDDTDHRILAALAAPRRLDEIEHKARAPRLRTLSFVHYLQAVGALQLTGVVAARPAHQPLGRHGLAL